MTARISSGSGPLPIGDTSVPLVDQPPNESHHSSSADENRTHTFALRNSNDAQRKKVLDDAQVPDKHINMVKKKNDKSSLDKSFLLQQEIQRLGGTFSPISQRARIVGAHLPEEGICWEVCRLWIKEKLAGTWRKDSTVYNLFDQPNNEFEEIVKRHKKSEHSRDEKNYKIPELQHVETLKREEKSTFKSPLSRMIPWNTGSSDFRDTKEIPDLVLNKPGVWSFTAMIRKGDGHVLALDTRDPKQLTIVDPNHGEMVLPNADAFKTIFHFVWGEFYKDEYKRGERRLDRYEMAAPAVPSSGPISSDNDEIRFSDPFHGAS